MSSASDSGAAPIDSAVSGSAAIGAAPGNYPRPLVLASESPRRAALLREAGYEFDVVVPTVKEPPSDHEFAAPEAMAEALAYFKARSVANQRADAAILAADTIVVLNNHVLGKPADADDARRIL